MPKKVAFSAKTSARQAEDWVSGSDANDSTAPSAAPTKLKTNASKRPNADVQSVKTEASVAAMKRLTLDIPDTLHRRIKAQCAMRNTKMVDEIRLLLEERFPEA